MIFIWSPRSCARGGTWGYSGGLGMSKFLFSKFIQIWCVSYLHEWHMHLRHFLVPTPLGLGEGPKGQISFNLNYKVIFKDFKPNFMYLLTNERYITYHTGFSFGRLGHAQEWDLGVLCGVGGSKFFFPEIQPDLVCELLT